MPPPPRTAREEEEEETSHQSSPASPTPEKRKDFPPPLFPLSFPFHNVRSLFFFLQLSLTHTAVPGAKEGQRGEKLCLFLLSQEEKKKEKHSIFTCRKFSHFFSLASSRLFPLSPPLSPPPFLSFSTFCVGEVRCFNASLKAPLLLFFLGGSRPLSRPFLSFISLFHVCFVGMKKPGEEREKKRWPLLLSFLSSPLSHFHTI